MQQKVDIFQNFETFHEMIEIMIEMSLIFLFKKIYIRLSFDALETHLKLKLLNVLCIIRIVAQRKCRILLRLIILPFPTFPKISNFK